MTTVAELGERALIERIRERVPPTPEWVVVGIGDDAAVLEFERNAVEVLTTDSSVEGVHFDRRFMPAAGIGHRALAANLSDLASMGARARAALLSLALPDELPLVQFDQIIDALLSLASRYRVQLVGGNIARSPGPLMIDLTALGTVHRRRVMRRTGARPGDVLFVSGDVGSAAAGLEWCRAHGMEAANAATADGGRRAESAARHPMEGAIARCLYPDPRLRLGWLLARNRAATACVDLSDGLADGIHQLAGANGVGAKIDADQVPVAPEVRRWFQENGRDPVAAAMTGGEDYELLFTVPGRRRRLISALSKGLAGVPLTAIGVITRDADLVLRGEGRRDEALPQGYSHFR